MKILMIFPGLIEDLPPIIYSAKALSAFVSKIHILSAGCSNTTLSTLNHPAIEIHHLGKHEYPKRLIGKLAFKLRFLWFIKKFSLSHKIDVTWAHGAHAMFYLPFLKRTKLLVAHAHELYDSFFLRTIQNYCIRKANIYIVPEENRAWILKATSKTKSPFHLIPNYFPAQYFQYEAESNYATEIFRNSGGNGNCKKLLIYQGLLSENRCLKELLLAFSEIDTPQVGLIVIGDGPDKKYINALKALIIQDDRIVLLPKVSPPGHLKITAGCFAGIVLYSGNSLNNIFCAPNKVFEYAACGLGMVLPNYPGMSRLIEDFDLGVGCDPDNISSINKSLTEITLRDADFFKNKCRRFLECTKTSEENYYELYKLLKSKM